MGADVADGAVFLDQDGELRFLASTVYCRVLESGEFKWDL
jgi:hypothetical protein